MSSTWCGTNLHLSIFGQSHGEAIGLSLDGLPAGEEIDLTVLQRFLQRRAPGQNAWSTPRKEEDLPEILSGLYEGRTCAAPFAALIRNSNTRSGDYAALRDIPRPGHADYTAFVKWGREADMRGGGHFSGRLTAPLCIAGGLALQILARRGVTIGAQLLSIGPVFDRPLDPVAVDAFTLQGLAARDFPTLDPQVGQAMQAAIAAARADGDSLGGQVCCAVVGLPAGLGAPIFDGMENKLAQLIFGIPACRGLDFGTGFAAAALRGSEHNDPFYFDSDEVKTRTNHHGGILGGITTGMPLLLRAAFKPTPSIARAQESISLSQRTSATLEVKGRHDPCIVPRALPCVEAATALAVLDALLEFKGVNPL